MAIIEENLVVGAFRGCMQESLEFRAELVFPYRPEHHKIPLHGQFVVVELDHPSEAVLGRIIHMSPEGRLLSPIGDDFSVRAVSEKTPIPDNVKDAHLRYRVGIRVLGMLREKKDAVLFVPSQRRMPHVGSRVAFLPVRILKEIVGQNGAEIGFLTMGEFIYAGNDDRCVADQSMTILPDKVLVRFPLGELREKKSFVFAKAGFGKSNLVKMLLALLYEKPPTSTILGPEVLTGTILFDPEGEYFWPDSAGRPGFCDIPHLSDKLVVFTNRRSPSSYYGSFIVGGVKLDIRQFSASDIASLTLPIEKQDQQNVIKIKSLGSNEWAEIVDLIYRGENNTDLSEIRRILKIDAKQDAEALAARGNLSNMVRMLHDPSSRFMDRLFCAIRKGCICVIDVSTLRGKTALVFSGLILRKIFQYNQRQFTEIAEKSLSCVAILEEAQSVLRSQDEANEPYVEWVKEGRKYDLGAVMVTQQPGSIPKELLSQADNFFVAHLLSRTDLEALKAANGHFSDDVLMCLLNEPIRGNMVMWSNAQGRTYPVPFRAFSFERVYPVADPNRNRESIKTAAQEVLKQTEVVVARSGKEEVEERGEEEDVLSQVKGRAMETVAKLPGYLELVLDSGKPWMDILSKLKDELPRDMLDRDKVASDLVSRLFNEYVGPEDKVWKVEKRPRANGGSDVKYVVGLPGSKVKRPQAVK